MKQKTTIHSILIILTFLIAFYGKRILGHFVDISFTSSSAKVIYAYSWWIVPVILVVSILYGFKNILKEMRLHQGILIGLAFAFVTVLPMFLGSAMIGNINSDISTLKLIQSTLLAGLMEEWLFRGFLFGILFRKLQWGFIPAAVLGAAIFGMGHIYQGVDFMQIMGIFAVTFMGAVWFAWLFIEWKENLWVPIFLHIFMNLSWTLFDVSSNALGGVLPNVFRITTIALTVILTIHYNKTKDHFRINKGNLWVH